MKYGVIYADPPWWYNNRKSGEERKNKATTTIALARKHYPLMRDKELIKMKSFIDGIADKNCALFLWATMPRLYFAIELLKEWGFRYATIAFVWIKCSSRTGHFVYGPGCYTASNCEVVLLGIRGSARPTVKMVPSIVMGARGKHSTKPLEVAVRIKTMYPELKAIELFARDNKEGWDAWGHEVLDSIDRPIGAEAYKMIIGKILNRNLDEGEALTLRDFIW